MENPSGGTAASWKSLPSRLLTQTGNHAHRLAGKRQLRRLETQLAESRDELLAPLSLEERQQLTELLSRLLAHHDR